MRDGHAEAATVADLGEKFAVRHFFARAFVNRPASIRIAR
jgi:hypothetical protein